MSDRPLFIRDIFKQTHRVGDSGQTHVDIGGATLFSALMRSQCPNTTCVVVDHPGRETARTIWGLLEGGKFSRLGKVFDRLFENEPVASSLDTDHIAHMYHHLWTNRNPSSRVIVTGSLPAQARNFADSVSWLMPNIFHSPHQALKAAFRYLKPNGDLHCISESPETATCMQDELRRSQFGGVTVHQSSSLDYRAPVSVYDYALASPHRYEFTASKNIQAINSR